MAGFHVIDAVIEVSCRLIFAIFINATTMMPASKMKMKENPRLSRVETFRFVRFISRLL